MDPLRHDPNEHWPEALALLARCEDNYRDESPYSALDGMDWTIVNPAGGEPARVEVSENIRAWAVMSFCSLFAEWALGGPEPFEERLAKYPTLATWAEAERAGRIEWVNPESANIDHPQTVVQSYAEHAFTAISFWMEAALRSSLREDRTVEDGTSSTVSMLARLLALPAMLTPQEAWDGIGAEVQHEVEHGEWVRGRRLADAVTRQHLPQWVGTSPSEAEGDTIVQCLTQLLPTLSDEEGNAILMFGVEPAITLTEVVWRKVNVVLSTEFNQRLLALVGQPSDEPALWDDLVGGFSAN